MRARIGLAFALLIAVAAAGPIAARADWDDRPGPDEYQTALSPHGYWVDDGGLGRVWRPSVAWDWRPYEDGQWVWTSYGWTWVSYEPWAWTFHYGNWGYSNLYGWVWSPGYVWSPAWVNWYWGDGFVGWAPLGIAGYPIAPSYWSYVHDYHFCSPRVDGVIIHDRRFLPDYIVHHQGRGVAYAPALDDMERVSRHPIVRRSDRPTDSIAPWVHTRLDRGEHVRERVADRGGERVIEHSGRPPARNDAPPVVVDDGNWRRRDDDGRAGGVMRPGQPTGTLTHQQRDDDDDADDARGHGGRRGDRQIVVDPGPRRDDDPGRRHQMDSRGWASPPRQAPQRDVMIPQVDRRVSPQQGGSSVAPQAPHQQGAWGGGHQSPAARSGDSGGGDRGQSGARTGSGQGGSIQIQR